MGRAPCCDKAKVKKGPWSVEEDALLKNFITKFGNGGNWISLPKKAGLNRCGKSCRLRWLNYLRPDIKHGGFSEEEEIIIFTLYHAIGSRWSVIASNLEGRTDNDVKNYWNTKLKKKIMWRNFNHIVPTNTTIDNLEISANVNEDCVTLISSNLTTGSKGQGDEKYAQSSSASQEICSYTGSSSCVDSYQNGSSSSSITSNRWEEDEFWIDLLSESFDDGIPGYQLEEKISEIASLLDVPIC